MRKPFLYVISLALIASLSACALFDPYETVSYSFAQLRPSTASSIHVPSVTIDGLPMDTLGLTTAHEIAISEAALAGIPLGTEGSIVIEVSQTQFTADLRTENSVVALARVMLGDDVAHRIITTGVMSATIASPHHLREILREVLVQLSADILAAGSSQ